MLQCGNFKNIMLGKNSQSQKTIYCMTAFIRNAQNRKMYRDEKQISGLVVVYVAGE